MCALLPRILRFKSVLNPPITEMTLEREQLLIATPQIESTLITVKNPLFCDRTWRAPTKSAKRAFSRRSRIHGRSAARRRTVLEMPKRIVETRAAASSGVHAEPRTGGRTWTQYMLPKKPASETASVVRNMTRIERVANSGVYGSTSERPVTRV